MDLINSRRGVTCGPVALHVRVSPSVLNLEALILDDFGRFAVIFYYLTCHVSYSQ